MGAFKPLLPFGDKTVIESCIAYLRRSQIEDIIVVVGHRANEIRDVVKDVNFATNPDPDSEMGASIAIGTQALPETARAVLIALVDHPAVPPTIVERVIEEWQHSNATVVIPTWQERGGHPVLIDLSLKAELAALDQTPGGLRELLRKHQPRVKRVPLDSPFVARDMDTWDDYRALHKEAFGYPPPSVSKTDQR
jgi:molybdenum cofactor cytidylyltransferase